MQLQVNLQKDFYRSEHFILDILTLSFREELGSWKRTAFRKGNDYMHPNYISSLHILKSLFSGPNETPFLIDKMRSHADGNKISLLDIGTGDGDGVDSIAEHLSHEGFEVHVTGIDLYIPVRTIPSPSLYSYITVQDDFRTYEPGSTFDIILARQSLYYFEDIDHIVKRLTELVAPGGLIVVVLWADDCILRRIAEIAAPTSAALKITPDVISNALLGQGFSVDRKEFDGDVDFTPIAEDHEALMKVIKFLGRSLGPHSSDVQKAYHYILDISRGTRRNTILFSTRVK